MKIMYRKYAQKEYEEIDLDELNYRLNDEEYHKKADLGIFIVELEQTGDNVLYFCETDAYDY